MLFVSCIFLILQSSSIIDDMYFYDENRVKHKLAIGDFIVRQGTSYESEIIKRLSGSAYSHVGLIVQINPQILIIHATTDDKIDKQNQVIISTLPEFIQPKLADGWAVYRNVKLTNEEIANLTNKAKEQMGKSFVLSVKGEQTHGVYCTTLIANYLPMHIYQSLQWQNIDVPSLSGDILYPKALIDEKIGSRLIYQEY